MVSQRFGNKQPPNDDGSRSKLKDRKAPVEKVDYATMGIVNVYQLIPKGMGPISAATLGITIPDSAQLLKQQGPSKQVRYDQPSGGPGGSGNTSRSSNIVVKSSSGTGKRKYVTKEQKQLRNKTESPAAVTYGFVDKSTSDSYRLQLVSKLGDNKIISKIEDIDSYEKILKNHKSLIQHYNRTDPNHLYIVNKAVQLVKIAKPKDKERVLKNQAMRLGVTLSTMRDYVNLYGKQLDALNPGEVFKRIENVESGKTPEGEPLVKRELTAQEIKETIIPKQKYLPPAPPIPIEEGSIGQIDRDAAKDVKKYLRLTSREEIIDLYKNKRNELKSLNLGDGNKEFYRDMSNISTERKRKLKKLNMKRPRLIFRSKKKLSKSVSMKKHILNKLRCKCRRKR